MTGKISKQSIIDAELARLYKKNGEMTALLVLKAAKCKSSPLHGEFEWNNRIAGERWRIDQAWRLIQASQYMVIILSKKEKGAAVVGAPISSGSVKSGLRGFIHAGDSFHPRGVTLLDPDLRKEFIREKKFELLGWCKSVQDVKEFDAIRKYIVSRV